MKMTFRWYGHDIDPIPLKYVKQIPGMTGLMGLLDKPAGVDWPEEEFAALKGLLKSELFDWTVWISGGLHLWKNKGFRETGCHRYRWTVF